MQAHWDDLRTVLELVRAGSLGGAAAVLEVSYTTVARRVTRLEAALGEVLFERLAEGYRPTQAGLLVAERAGEMQAREDALRRELTGRDARLSGPLVITAPQLVIAHLLGPVLQDFTEAHPDVDLSIRATNDMLDLTRREADLAIRVSATPGDTLTGLRLTGQQTASFATPDWAARIEAAPDGVIDWVVYADHKQLPQAVRDSYPGSRIRYRFDDMVAMIGAAEAGLGVVRAPLFLGRASPGLVPVPCLPPTPYTDIWAVAHRDVWGGAKLAAFRGVLKRHLPAIRDLCGHIG